MQHMNTKMVLFFSLFVIVMAIHANFAQDTSKTVQLVVIKSGESSGTITSSPPGIHCGDTVQDCSASFASGTAITLTPEEMGQGSVFVGWSEGEGSTTSCEGLRNPCSFIITENSKITGTFRNESNPIFTVSVTVQGSGSGVVSSIPEGVLCGDGHNKCMVSFPANADVTLSAQPTKEDSVFKGWSAAIGSAQSCNNTTSACVFSIAENIAISATFDLANTGSPEAGELTLTASKTGNGPGLIVSAPPGIECGDGGTGCTASFSAGTAITLTGKPTAAGSTFAGWTAGTGSASTCMGAVGPCALILTEESSVTGTFVQK
jgi:hypothetical protein